MPQPYNLKHRDALAEKSSEWILNNVEKGNATLSGVLSSYDGDTFRVLSAGINRAAYKYYS